MNYSEMSDFEINCFVAEELGMKPFSTLGWKGAQEGKFTAAISKGPNKIGAFDPCNSWADAGPIIVSNLIALKPVSLFVGGHRWFAIKGEGDFDIKAADNNPLRAAMIVFLMMQGAANA